MQFNLGSNVMALLYQKLSTQCSDDCSTKFGQIVWGTAGDQDGFASQGWGHFGS
jgi:hypothetical protein